jgi:WD40 repeat protein
VDPNPTSPIQVLRGFGLEEPGLGFVSENLLRRATNAGFGIRDITWPPDAAPRYLNKPPESTLWAIASQPNGCWSAVKLDDRIFFWPLRGPFPRVLPGHSAFIQTLAFVGEGDHLVTGSFNDQTIRLWPLAADSGELSRVLWERPSPSGFSKVVSDPAGQNLLVSNVFSDGDVFLLPISDEKPVVTTLWQEDGSRAWPVAFSMDGRRAAAGAAGGVGDEDVVIRVWDLESREEAVLPLRKHSGGGELGAFDLGVGSLRFTPDGDLLSAGGGGVRLWDLDTGTAEWLLRVPDAAWVWMHASRDTRFLLTTEVPKWGPTDFSNLTLHDRRLGTSHAITSHGQYVSRWALDPTGTIVVTTASGVIRVGPADGSEPHLLYGHDGAVKDVEISPDGRWIASGGIDTFVRLWPMPDVSKPPLHTLPREELIAKLKTFTNLRVVRDEESSAGWKLEVGPFPGWETVPTW